MKFLITEIQNKMIGIDRKSDIIHQFLITMYPENYQYENNNNETIVHPNEESKRMLFYYDWDDKDFYIETDFINEIFDVTGIELFNVHELTSNIEYRETFNEIIKLFAKKNYGWNVKRVWFHWYYGIN